MSQENNPNKQKISEKNPGESTLPRVDSPKIYLTDNNKKEVLELIILNNDLNKFKLLLANKQFFEFVLLERYSLLAFAKKNEIEEIVSFMKKFTTTAEKYLNGKIKKQHFISDLSNLNVQLDVLINIMKLLPNIKHEQTYINDCLGKIEINRNSNELFCLLEALLQSLKINEVEQMKSKLKKTHSDQDYISYAEDLVNQKESLKSQVLSSLLLDKNSCNKYPLHAIVLLSTYYPNINKWLPNVFNSSFCITGLIESMRMSNNFLTHLDFAVALRQIEYIVEFLNNVFSKVQIDISTNKREFKKMIMELLDDNPSSLNDVGKRKFIEFVINDNDFAMLKKILLHEDLFNNVFYNIKKISNNCKQSEVFNFILELKGFFENYYKNKISHQELSNILEGLGIEKDHLGIILSLFKQHLDSNLNKLETDLNILLEKLDSNRSISLESIEGLLSLLTLQQRSDDINILQQGIPSGRLKIEKILETVKDERVRKNIKKIITFCEKYPLHSAIYLLQTKPNLIKLVHKLLSDFKLDPNEKSKLNRDTPLSLAIKLKQVEAVMGLLKQPHIKIEDEQKEEIMKLIISKCKQEALAELLVDNNFFIFVFSNADRYLNNLNKDNILYPLLQEISLIKEALVNKDIASINKQKILFNFSKFKVQIHKMIQLLPRLIQELNKHHSSRDSFR